MDKYVCPVSYTHLAFGMSLGVAGAGHTEIAPAADKGHQLIGVGKVGLGREVGVAVAPEGQHVLHPVLLEAGEQLGDLSLGACLLYTSRCV